MIRHEDNGYWIEQRQEIPAHHEEAFACLTTGAGLSRWLPVAAEVDCQVGGVIRLGWDEKFRGSSTLAILDYDAAGSIAWDWIATSDNTHAPVYWRVEPAVEKGCVLHFRQGPFGGDAESMATMAEQAWFWCWHLCNLRSVLEARLDMRSVRPL